VQKFWIPQLDGVCTIDDSKFFFGTVLTHLVIDLAILALPAIEVQKLRLPMTQKLGIMGMFMFGIFVCVASVVVIAYSKQYDATAGDMQWNIAPIIIWATVEVNLAIVSGKSTGLHGDHHCSIHHVHSGSLLTCVCNSLPPNAPTNLSPRNAPTN
jgi:hypothetical protein